MDEREKKKFLFLESFYLKVKDSIRELEEKLGIKQEPEEMLINLKIENAGGKKK